MPSAQKSIMSKKKKGGKFINTKKKFPSSKKSILKLIIEIIIRKDKDRLILGEK